MVVVVLRFSCVCLSILRCHCHKSTECQVKGGFPLFCSWERAAFVGCCQCWREAHRKDKNRAQRFSKRAPCFWVGGSFRKDLQVAKKHFHPSFALWLDKMKPLNTCVVYKISKIPLQNPFKKYVNIDFCGINALFIWQGDSILLIWMTRFDKSDQLVQQRSVVLTFAATYRQFRTHTTEKPSWLDQPVRKEVNCCLTKMPFGQETQSLYLHKDWKDQNVKSVFAVTQHVSPLWFSDQYLKFVILMLTWC